jgi:arylsulfatase A-like enzyme
MGITRVMLVLKGGEKARISRKPQCSKIFTEKAVDFIERHANQPFLLYFAPNNVHVAIKPGDEFKGKSRCGPYGDYVAELDWMVGEVLSVLDRCSLAENTFVLFASDNGGGYYKPHNAEAHAMGHRINGNLLGQKSDVWEGGHRVPLIVRWPGNIAPGTQTDAMISLCDLMATMADILGVSLPEDAGPDSESFLHALTGEGKPGSCRNSIVYQGMFEGLLAIRQGEWVLIPDQGSDGITLSGQHNAMTFSELGFENSDYSAAGKIKPDAPPGQLYDLSADISQAVNLYRIHPEKVRELTGLLEEITTGKQKL